MIHSYEKVEEVFLWGLVKRHIPKLKNDVELIIAEYEDELKDKTEGQDPQNE